MEPIRKPGNKASGGFGRNPKGRPAHHAAHGVTCSEWEECFRWPVRVYYEDTDAAGVVYYANYLRYLERARTEWLASLGFTLTALEREHGVVFVVHRLDIEYRQPARLYDALEATLGLAARGHSRLVAVQEVFRGEEQQVRAQVTLACLESATWRPARIPTLVVAKMHYDKGS